MKIFLDLVQYLEEKKVGYVPIDTAKERHSQPAPYVVSNGFKIICTSRGYEAKTIMGNKPVPGVVATAEDCYNIITKGIFSDSPYQSIFNYFKMGDSDYLKKIPKYLRQRISYKKKELAMVEKDYSIGKMELKEAVSQFELILMTTSKNHVKKCGDIPNLLKLGMIPYVGELVIELPVNRTQELNGSVTLENLIIFNILTSFPYLINAAVRWSKNGYPTLNIQKNLDKQYSGKKATTVKSLPVGWVLLIKDSERKELIWNNITDYVCLNKRYENIKTANPVIWEQFLIAMRVVKYDSSKHHVPAQFIENLKQINIYI